VFGCSALDYHDARGLDILPAEPAMRELESRGRGAVAGMVATLEDALTCDAARADYVRSLWIDNPGLVSLAQSRATSFRGGIVYLLTRVTELGAGESPLRAWSTYPHSAYLRGVASSYLDCLKMNRRDMVGPSVGVGCARAGEICDHGVCHLVLGEHCTSAGQCFSNACEAAVCCQPAGEDCSERECCASGTCVEGHCRSAIQ
jgi:hypothetical protein